MSRRGLPRVVRSVLDSATNGFICGCAWSAVTLAAATLRRTSMPPSISIKPDIPSCVLSSPVRPGAGAMLIRLSWMNYRKNLICPIEVSAGTPYREHWRVTGRESNAGCFDNLNNARRTALTQTNRSTIDAPANLFKLVEGAFNRSASPGHTSLAKLFLVPL